MTLKSTSLHFCYCYLLHFKLLVPNIKPLVLPLPLLAAHLMDTKVPVYVSA